MVTVTVEDARAAAASVLDPEVPVLTIADLGVLREVEVRDDGTAVVTITPTYSGCPAMDVIRADIAAALHADGYPDVAVDTTLAEPWTTDWMTETGRRALQDYGIAAPSPRRTAHGNDLLSGPVSLSLSVRCPQCGSADTRETSRFGSTACKSLWVCRACREPFDHFKAI
jgi:ring-1,2-phenylacetyl-CoA epoxidase subunit PaaD